MYFEKFCKACPPDVHCCIFNHDTGFTFVGISDATRIKEDTGQEFSEFLDFSPLPVAVKKSLNKDDRALEGALRLSQLDDKGRILRLKKQANGKCVFLTKTGKCGIYGSRPNICRIYPFWAMRLLDGSIKAIEHDSVPRCPIVLSLRKKSDDIEECLPASQLQQIMSTFEAIEREDKEYRKRIGYFHKGV